MYPICLDGLNFAASVENYFFDCGKKIAEKFGVAIRFHRKDIIAML